MSLAKMGTDYAFLIGSLVHVFRKARHHSHILLGNHQNTDESVMSEILRKDILHKNALTILR